MEIRELKYFLTCVEKGSITGAAEELYTSQPHVSMVIGSLEKELGTPLFKRTGKGLILTDTGNRIRIYAQNILKNQELIRETCVLTKGHHLSIAANSSSTLAFTISDYFCSSSKDRLLMNYTECKVEDIMDLVQYSGYDLGFLFLPESKLTAFSHMLRKRHLEYVPITYSDLVVHCSKMGPFWNLPEVEPKDLNMCRCIQSQDQFFAIEELLYENQEFRTGKYKLDIVIRTNSDHLLMDMLKRTDLSNVGSFWSYRDDIMKHAHMAKIKGFEKKVSFGYLKSDNTPLSEPAREIIQAIKEKTGEKD